MSRNREDVSVSSDTGIIKPLNERIEGLKKLIEVSDAKLGEYKGNNLLILKASSRFPFQFGLGKAKVIVENYELIKAFADANVA